MDAARKEIRNALVSIVKNRNEKALNWAVEYARFGIELIDDNCDDDSLRIQLVYVTGNISRWRGEEAKQVRDTLKNAIKSLQPVWK